MTRRSHYLLFLFLLVLPGVPPAEGQASRYRSVLDDPLVQFQADRGLDFLYDLQFARAYRLFDQIDRRYPRHPIGPFLKALTTWWEILLDLSDTSHDGAFYASMEEVIDRSDRLLKQDPNHFDAIFFKGAALGFRGRLRSNRGEWFQAALDGKKAMDYVLRVARKDPRNADFIFGKGIYDYYSEVLRDRYPLARPIMTFFPQGDRLRGLGELKMTAQKGKYIQTEAVYFLGQIYFIFERDFDKSVEYVNWLRKNHPNNSFFHTFEGRLYAQWGYWNRSKSIFDQVLVLYQRKKAGYNTATAEQAYYYLARADMAMSNFPAAVTGLKKLEALAARRKVDTYFRTWGLLRLGMAYDALGRRADALRYYQTVLKIDDRGGSHDMARTYTKTPYRRGVSSANR